DRTAATGVLRGELARQFGAGGYVGRASGRALDARKMPGYPPYDRLDFEGPRFDARGVNPPPLGGLPPGRPSLAFIGHTFPPPARFELRSIPMARCAKGLEWRKRFAVTCWCGCASKAAASRVVTCAIRPGFNGRCWKLRSRAISSPTSHCATNRSTALIPVTISRITACAGFYSTA